MLKQCQKVIMKRVRTLIKFDKKSHGFVSTLITALILAVLLVGAIVSNELSQKKLQTVSRAQISNPDNAACASSCQTQSLNGVNFMGGECLGLCMDPRSEFTNTQFTCQGASACCCFLPAPTATPADTCNADCVAATYSSGSCQNATVQGGGLCSTGGTTINGNGGCGTKTCCCVFTGATATPTITPIPSITLTCTETDGGINYNQQGSMYYCNSVGSCQTTNDICISSTTLNENFCDAAKNGVLQQYTCPNGCANGACISNLTPTTTLTATLPPIATPATACGQSCNQLGANDGYCSATVNSCSTANNPPDTVNSAVTCTRGSCCCIWVSPTVVQPSPTATVTTAPPTSTPASCQSNFCPYGYYCFNNLCVTGTPTPTFTPIPSQPATPTCFNPKPPILSPGVTRNGDTITVAWNNQIGGLISKVELCMNGGGTCQIIFEGTSPATNSIQKTISNISGKDIIVQMTTTNQRCGTTSDLTSQYLSANATSGVNVPAATVAYSNGTPAWLIAGAAFIVVLLITVAIVAM